jgi:hypothetical protein
MISTLAQVKTRTLGLLDDPNGARFTDAVLLPAIGEGLDALWGAFTFYEIPRSKVVATYTLAANTTSVSPAVLGIDDMGEVIELRERRFGSTDRFTHVREVDDLPQRDAIQVLGEWEWRADTLWFVGATEARELWISYFSTTGQPSALDSTSTGVDGCLTFLSKYAAGIAGPRKGNNEMAAVYMKHAVGGRYDEGVIGGELYRLCQPMVRARQRVPVAPQPFSVIRRRAHFARTPYIAAQQPVGVGVAPALFSYFAGTIAGDLDGSNATFYLSYPVSAVNVILNGATLTPTQHYTHGANVVTFLAPYIPQPGADILVEGWL